MKDIISRDSKLEELRAFISKRLGEIIKQFKEPDKIKITIIIRRESDDGIDAGLFLSNDDVELAIESVRQLQENGLAFYKETIQ
jgi:hypothetical protein